MQPSSIASLVRTSNAALELIALALLGLVLMALIGCGDSTVEESAADTGASSTTETGAETDATAATTPDATDSMIEQPIGDPREFAVDAAGLLAGALPEAELKEGWVNLFDGQSLFGWFIYGKANWRVEEGSIKVDRGEKSFLCTNLQLADYELSVDFRGDANTNSGVFLRTLLSPQDVTMDCIELNIAPPENPFPTGSLVQRKKLETADLGNFDPTAWHTFHVRMDGDQVTVSLDGKQMLEYTDDSGLEKGHISLQHNEGRIEFKNVRLRPLAAKSLKLDDSWEEDWTKSAKDGAEFNVEPTKAGLKVTGGLGQVQSKADFGDFFLQACYQLQTPDVNSGIFFRCIRDSMLDGYECQLNHTIKNDDPLQPADGGAGAIFRRAQARVVVGDGKKPTYVTLLAQGPQIATWVNGIQVVEFEDTRAADDNPRKGLRTAPGPISLQGHDPTTAAIFKSIKVTKLN